MSLSVPQPLPFTNHDLLVLESAAKLSMVAESKYREFLQCEKEWERFSERSLESLEGASDRPGVVLGQMLEQLGLAFSPEALSYPGPYLHKTLLGAAQRVQAEPHGCAPVHACLAVLNCFSKPRHFIDLRSRVLEEDVISRSWWEIRKWLQATRSKMSYGGGPRMLKPASDEWNAHDPVDVGDYAPWSRGIGPMFHTLGGWDSVWAMPRRPSEGAEHRDWIEYWSPLPQLALGPLGWSDPALGIARWILNGMPTKSPELSLLRRRWGSMSLAYFCHPQRDWIPDEGGCNDLISAKTTGTSISYLFDRSIWSVPYSKAGGLHMSAHLGWQMLGGGEEKRRSQRPVVYRADSAEAGGGHVLVLGRFHGWYATLSRVGKELIDAGDRSDLEIKDVAPPVGMLGTFRRSLRTKRWHSTTPEEHELGH